MQCYNFYFVNSDGDCDHRDDSFDCPTYKAYRLKLLPNRAKGAEGSFTVAKDAVGGLRILQINLNHCKDANDALVVMSQIMILT